MNKKVENIVLGMCAAGVISGAALITTGAIIAKNATAEQKEIISNHFNACVEENRLSDEQISNYESNYYYYDFVEDEEVLNQIHDVEKDFIKGVALAGSGALLMGTSVSAPLTNDNFGKSLEE